MTNGLPACPRDGTQCEECFRPIGQRVSSLTGKTHKQLSVVIHEHTLRRFLEREIEGAAELLGCFANIDKSRRFPLYRCSQLRARSEREIESLRESLFVPTEDSPDVALSHALESDFPVPIPEGKSLFPFQRVAVEYAQGKRFVLIADDMGVGKTIQAIGIVNAEPDPGRVLVLCTATLKGNWRRELEAWLTRPLSICVVEGKKKITEANVTIINYDLLASRELPGEFDTVIADEAHYLRNIDSQRTQAALPYLSAARRVILLTGTPVPTSPYDLWPVISISGLPLADGYLERYVEESPREIDNGYGKMVPITPRRRGKNQEELQRRLRASCMIKRSKAEVLPQLPALTRQIIEIPGGAALSEDVALRISRLLQGDDDYRRAAFSRPAEGTIDGQISVLRHEEAILKAPHVARHVASLLDGNEIKCVVFAHHRDVIDLLHEKLGKFFPVVITGATPSGQRDRLVQQFQTEPKCRVFVGNIHAAGEGITLHAAALAVFAELDWQFHKILQAEARIHRVGQEAQNVLVQHVVFEGGIDSLIVRAMIAKQAGAGRVIG